MRNLEAFTVKVGEISEVIETPKMFFLLKVESRQPGEADDFDDPKVPEVAGALFAEQRRRNWEKNYLEHLQKRIE